jgi:hypothetical protein
MVCSTVQDLYNQCLLQYARGMPGSRIPETLVCVHEACQFKGSTQRTKRMVSPDTMRRPVALQAPKEACLLTFWRLAKYLQRQSCSAAHMDM